MNTQTQRSTYRSYTLATSGRSWNNYRAWKPWLVWR